MNGTNSPIKSGYLSKEGVTRKSWKRRWFVLRAGDGIYYFKAQKDEWKDQKELGYISLREITALSENYSVFDRTKPANTIAISTPRRVYFVASDTNSEMLSWKESIYSALEKVNPTLFPPAGLPAVGSSSSSLRVPPVSTPRGSTSPIRPHSSPTVSKVGLDDFDILAVVGEGSYGIVAQVRHKASGGIYAMKMLNKKHILEVLICHEPVGRRTDSGATNCSEVGDCIDAIDTV
jgi:hypothetical protein